MTACLVFAVALLGCAGEVKVTYPVVPSTLPLRSTTTSTIGPDRSKMSLPTIDVSLTTTTTIVFGEGRASLTGIVTGPDGPVAGAKVRIERLVGSAHTETVVDADDSGRYRLENVELGRLRVRSWRAPDLAMMSDDVFFAAGTTKHDLALTSFGRTDVQWAMAPSNPVTGNKVNLVVQVSTRAVDDAGLISVVPLNGVGVSVYPTGFLVPQTVGEKLTNDEGRALFSLRCDSDGSSGLDVRLATGGQALISPPPCRTPVVTVPPTEAPPVVQPVEPAVPVADPSATGEVSPVQAVTTVPVSPTTRVPVAPVTPAPTVIIVPNPVIPQPQP